MEGRKKKDGKEVNKARGILAKLRKDKAAAAMAAAFAILVVAAGPQLVSATTATDASSVITEKFDAFYELLAAIISSFGMIFTLWGISEWGVAFQTSEGSMQSQAFKKIAGGLIMCLAPQLVPLLIG